MNHESPLLPRVWHTRFSSELKLQTDTVACQNLNSLACQTKHQLIPIIKPGFPSDQIETKICCRTFLNRCLGNKRNSFARRSLSKAFGSPEEARRCSIRVWALRSSSRFAMGCPGWRAIPLQLARDVSYGDNSEIRRQSIETFSGQGASTHLLQITQPGREKASPILANPILANPILANPILVNPILVNPILVNPILVNPILVNPIPTSRITFPCTHCRNPGDGIELIPIRHIFDVDY